MPDTTILPMSSTPSLRQRLAHHPFETIVAAWWIYIGSVFLSMQAGNGISVISVLPLIPAVILCGWVILGGILALLGLFWLGKHRSTAWAVERWGWTLGGTGWLAYLIAVWTVNPTRYAIGLAITMVLLSGARLIVLRMSKRRTIHRIKRWGLT